MTIIGAGGIGAPLALSLAKMGVKKMHIWDADVVNEENMGPQMYGPRHLGSLKVDALKNLLRGQAPWCNVTVHKEFYTEASSNNSEVVITALDSLAARKGVWKTIDHDVCKLFVDPRMGAEVLTILSVVPKEDGGWYAPTLEGEALEVKCTAKATFHCGFMAGALAAREVQGLARWRAHLGRVQRLPSLYDSVGRRPESSAQTTRRRDRCGGGIGPHDARSRYRDAKED